MKIWFRRPAVCLSVLASSAFVVILYITFASYGSFHDGIGNGLNVSGEKIVYNAQFTYDALQIYLTTTTVYCNKNVTYGEGENSWPVCVEDFYKPRGRGNCHMYSFKYDDNLSFEHSVHREYGCVSLFNPRINKIKLRDQSGMQIVEMGLGGSNKLVIRRLERSWRLVTLAETLDWLNNENEYLDYLKIEGNMEMLIDCLKTIMYNRDLLSVKQLALLIDIPTNSSSMHTQELYNIIQQIESAGFKKWYSEHSDLSQLDSNSFKLGFLGSKQTNAAETNDETPGPDRWEKLTESEAEEYFDKYVHETEIKCSRPVRVGGIGDGTWLMCLDKGLTIQYPCLVYSFGINFDWKFDEDMSRKYDCKIKSFDPSMNIKEGQQADRNIQFYRRGLADDQYINKMGWQMNTLKGFTTELSDSGTTIDYLKVDIEYGEWTALEAMIFDNSLSKVKQIGIEVHTKEAIGFPILTEYVSSKDNFERYLRVLRNLKDFGFKRWSVHNNQYGMYDSKRTGKRMTCCFEIYLINMKYIL